MRWMTLLLLAAFAALAPAPAAAQLEGSYRMAEVNGQALPAEVEDGVTVLSGALTLGAGQRYVLEAEIDIEDEGLIARRIEGAWEVDGDLLFLEPNEDQGAAPSDFTVALDGDRLMLRDEDEEMTITFVRQ